jgi:hypothetical protein
LASIFVYRALTCAVLLWIVIEMSRRGRAREEIADELHDVPTSFRNYRRLSLWILFPLAVPPAAIRD